MEQTANKVNDIFYLCCLDTSKSTTDFQSILKVFWKVLDNNIALCEISGIFTLVQTNYNTVNLNSSQFAQFFNCVAVSKYPHSKESQAKANLIKDILDQNNKSINSSSSFSKVIDKEVIKVLLKYEIPLRRYFSIHSSKNNFKSNLTWIEVKSQSISLDFEGFVSFCGVCSIIPEVASLETVEQYWNEVISQYSLLESRILSIQDNSVLYPQFQVLLLLLSVNYYENNSVHLSGSPPTNESSFIVEAFTLFLRVTNIDRMSNLSLKVNSSDSQLDDKSYSEIGYVSLPSIDRNADPYYGYRNHNQESTLLRLDQLFEEVFDVVQSCLDELSYNELNNIEYIVNNENARSTNTSCLSNPTAIADSIPIPLNLSDIITQLLRASTANHNLGNYEDALKFIEAARIQMLEEKKINGPENTQSSHEVASMYFAFTKGNIYQSCCDDEQSLIQYLSCLNTAKYNQNSDWISITLNSIGILAYYSKRFEIALNCFIYAVNYRHKV